jgi:hypothetical protein
MQGCLTPTVAKIVIIINRKSMAKLQSEFLSQQRNDLCIRI